MSARGLASGRPLTLADRLMPTSCGSDVGLRCISPSAETAGEEEKEGKEEEGGGGKIRRSRRYPREEGSNRETSLRLRLTLRSCWVIFRRLNIEL